jgi:hypothetical protein
MENKPNRQEITQSALWDELSSRIERGEVITSSGEPYTAENFRQGLAIARASHFNNMRGLTRSENVRQETARLLIAEATTLQELYALLEEAESIPGSEEDFSSSELIRRIENITNVLSADEATWEDFYRTMTRSYGLRDAVKRCVENPGNETELPLAA